MWYISLQEIVKIKIIGLEDIEMRCLCANSRGSGFHP